MQQGETQPQLQLYSFAQYYITTVLVLSGKLQISLNH